MSKCPGCGADLDACTQCEGRSIVETRNYQMRPGDVGICGHCATFLVVSPSYVFRLMTLEEVGHLPDDERIKLQRVRRRIEAHRAES